MHSAERYSMPLWEKWRENQEEESSAINSLIMSLVHLHHLICMVNVYKNKID